MQLHFCITMTVGALSVTIAGLVHRCHIQISRDLHATREPKIHPDSSSCAPRNISGRHAHLRERVLL
jgi:hypothetical protein